MHPDVAGHVRNHTVRTCHIQVGSLAAARHNVAVGVQIVAVGIRKLFCRLDALHAAEIKPGFLGRHLDAHRVALAAIVPEAADDGCTALHDLRELHVHQQRHALVLDGVVIILLVKHERINLMRRSRTVRQQHRRHALRVGVPPVRAEVNARKRSDAAPVASRGQALAVRASVGGQLVPVAHRLPLCHSCSCRHHHGKGSRHAAYGDCHGMGAARVEALVQRLQGTVCRKPLCDHFVNGHLDGGFQVLSLPYGKVQGHRPELLR